jgi:hypothetical protein
VTGLIYVAIIALWAAVLVPMWLRRHDHASESRNVERFNTAMRSLSGSRRRGRRPGDREVLQPRRPREREVVVTGARRRVRDTERMSASEVRAARGLDRAEQTGRRTGGAAARRRRVLAVLALLTVATAVAVVLGAVPALVLAVPAVMLVVFVVLAPRRPAGRATAATRPAPRRRRAAEVEPDLRPRPGRRTIDPLPAPVTGPALAPTGTDGAPLDGWEPVPTTLPTYVNAPRASGIPRILDLTTPGTWTSAAMLEHAQQLRHPHRDLHAEQEAVLAEDWDDVVADYADPQPPRRRAVND